MAALSIVVALGTISAFEHRASGLGAENQLSPPPVVVNWESPLPDSVSEQTITDANSVLSFKLVVPTGLSDAPRIVVSNPDSYLQTDREAALVYQSVNHGPFNVLERVSDTTQKELESLVEHNSDGGSTLFKVVTLEDGTEALLETGANANSVQWLDGGVNLVVVGPTGTFTSDDALQVADLVVSAQPSK